MHRDAMLIALVVSNGVKYFSTWNFKRIANAHLRSKIEETCRTNGNTGIQINGKSIPTAG